MSHGPTHSSQLRRLLSRAPEYVKTAGSLLDTGRFVNFSRDVTEQKRTEAALLQGEKFAAVGRLPASIAHEINNPLEADTNLFYLTRRTSNGDMIEGHLTSTEQNCTASQ